MKIAIISPWAISKSAIGGTERFTIDLADQFRDIGHSVTVFTFSGKDQRINNTDYISLDILGNGRIANEYDIREIAGDFSEESSFCKIAEKIEGRISLEEFDVIQINSLLLLKAWTKKQRFFTIHTNPFEYKLDWGDTAFSVMIDALKSQTINHLTKISAPSKHYADYFSKLIDSTVINIPHAIDVSRLICTKNSQSLRSIYGLDQNKVTLLLPSRLEPNQKRPHILFEALGKIDPSFKNNLQVISSGVDTQYVTYKTDLEQLAAKNNIPARFVYFKDIAEAYRLADIIILPSASESFGYSALESLSLEKITILNNLPTFKEIAQDNPNAFFFNHTSTNLAKVINSILEHRVTSVSNSDLWISRYEPKLWVNKYQEVIESCIST